MLHWRQFVTHRPPSWTGIKPSTQSRHSFFTDLCRLGAYAAATMKACSKTALGLTAPLIHPEVGWLWEVLAQPQALTHQSHCQSKSSLAPAFTVGAAQDQKQTKDVDGWHLNRRGWTCAESPDNKLLLLFWTLCRVGFSLYGFWCCVLLFCFRCFVCFFFYSVTTWWAVSQFYTLHTIELNHEPAFSVTSQEIKTLVQSIMSTIGIHCNKWYLFCVTYLVNFLDFTSAPYTI